MDKAIGIGSLKGNQPVAQSEPRIFGEIYRRGKSHLLAGSRMQHSDFRCV